MGLFIYLFITDLQTWNSEKINKLPSENLEKQNFNYVPEKKNVIDKLNFVVQTIFE